MPALRATAYAKINLYLHVTGKRADGYHLLDSLVAFGDDGDVLEAAPADTVGLVIDGPFAAYIDVKTNSVLKAARALQSACHVKAGVALTLHKNLPVAAGIGGGSADAAAALRLLQQLWNVTLPEAELHALALSLGADVPACLRARSQYMSGIGEILSPGPDTHGLAVVLVNPLMQLLTRDVFALFGSGFASPAEHVASFASQRACVKYLSGTANSLQPAALARLPVLQEVLAALDAGPCALNARMSGSGATCFALLTDLAAATQAAQSLSRAHPDWWVKAMALR